MCTNPCSKSHICHDLGYATWQLRDRQKNKKKKKKKKKKNRLYCGGLWEKC